MLAIWDLELLLVFPSSSHKVGDTFASQRRPLTVGLVTSPWKMMSKSKVLHPPSLGICLLILYCAYVLQGLPFGHPVPLYPRKSFSLNYLNRATAHTAHDQPVRANMLWAAPRARHLKEMLCARRCAGQSLLSVRSMLHAQCCHREGRCKCMWGLGPKVRVPYDTTPVSQLDWTLVLGHLCSFRME